MFRWNQFSKDNRRIIKTLERWNVNIVIQLSFRFRPKSIWTNTKTERKPNEMISLFFWLVSTWIHLDSVCVCVCMRERSRERANKRCYIIRQWLKMSWNHSCEPVHSEWTVVQITSVLFGTQLILFIYPLVSAIHTHLSYITCIFRKHFKFISIDIGLFKT